MITANQALNKANDVLRKKIDMTNDYAHIDDLIEEAAGKGEYATTVSTTLCADSINQSYLKKENIKEHYESLGFRVGEIETNMVFEKVNDEYMKSYSFLISWSWNLDKKNRMLR